MEWSVFNLIVSVIIIQTPAMIFFSTAEIGNKDMAIDIYSRRGAKSANVDDLNVIIYAKIHVTSAFSTPLRENRILVHQHRQIYWPYENVQQLSD